MRPPQPFFLEEPRTRQREIGSEVLIGKDIDSGTNRVKTKSNYDGVENITEDDDDDDNILGLPLAVCGPHSLASQQTYPSAASLLADFLTGHAQVVAQ